MTIETIQTFHGEFRWLVVGVVVITLIKFVAGWLAKQKYGALDRGLMTALNLVLGIQFLLGLTLFIWKVVAGAFAAYQLEHLITMLIAVALPGMLGARIRRADSDRLRYQLGVLMIFGIAVLVFLGVSLLPGNGWDS